MKLTHLQDWAAAPTIPPRQKPAFAALEIFQRTGAAGEAARVGAELDALAQNKQTAS
jgi:hypothetical protein